MKILVVAELLEGKVRKTTLSAITLARQLAASGGSYDVLVLGEGARGAAEELKGYGAGKLICVEIGGGYLCEKYAPTVAAQAKEGSYEALIATSSAYGKDLMARVAAKLGAGVAPDVADAKAEGGKVSYRRAMFAGNAFGNLSVGTPVQVITPRQSDFEAAEPSGGESTLVEAPYVDDPLASKVKFEKLEAVKSERPELSEAEVVVAGGRALKSAENFQKVLEPLVDALGAAMGASRAACDAGYVSNDLQVGQTGKVVAPKLYIAVGISGAIQHLAGMKGSKVIVAINKDKEAPIAQVADYYMAADLFQIVPELTQAVQGLKS
mgnify:CR=1 FL=1